jgi:phosphopantothenoylcysteine decarboxylase/phosphopantothenate--cysteine ligase
MWTSKVNSKKRILFKLTGSIACFKAVGLISKLVQDGFDVQVAASASALKFVGEATLEGLSGKPIAKDTFGTGQVMEHIHLMREADLIVVCPATANFINKIAHGVGDDLLSTMFLAHDFKKPYLIAPAMNVAMWNHPATQSSLNQLRTFGVQILPTESGNLACGEFGEGRLLNPDRIYENIRHAEMPREDSAPRSASDGKEATSSAARKKIVVTSGGTTESLDDVRILTNVSTGRTGAELADGLTDLGYEVLYLHARSAVRPRMEMKSVEFTNFDSLDRALRDALRDRDVRAVIHAAAVSDYRVQHVETGGRELQTEKDRKKWPSGQEITLKLTPTYKIVDRLKSYSERPDLKVVAFKLTSNPDAAVREDAVQSLFKHSQCDFVVHNDLSEVRPAAGTGEHLTRLYSSPTQNEVCESIAQLIFNLSLQLERSLK